MLLPAAGVAVDRWSVWVGLADHVDPLATASAVDSHFGLAQGLWALLARMTLGHTLVLTKLSLLPTDLTAAILHQVFETDDALAGRVAYLGALMSALQHLATLLAAVEVLVFAEGIREDFLTAVAELRHPLQTGRTGARMTVHRALMAALELLRAWLVALRRLHAALDRRINLLSTTRAVERLVGDPLAWRTEAHVAEVAAFVEAAAKLLLASDHAEMLAFGVSGDTKRALDRTTNLLTPMLAAPLHLIADLLALDYLVLINLLLSHEELLLLLRVVELVALGSDFGLAALA